MKSAAFREGCKVTLYHFIDLDTKTHVYHRTNQKLQRTKTAERNALDQGVTGSNV